MRLLYSVLSHEFILFPIIEIPTKSKFTNLTKNFELLKIFS